MVPKNDLLIVGTSLIPLLVILGLLFIVQNLVNFPFIWHIENLEFLVQLVEKIGKEFRAIRLNVLWVECDHFLDKNRLRVNTIALVVIFTVVIF